MSIKKYIRSRLRSIRIALDGLRQVILTQQNARIHAAFTLAVFLAAGLLRLPRQDWVLLALVVGFVWAAEIFNTAVELLVDLVSPEQSSVAKMVKDMSAGAVLVSVLVSILTGLLVFGPRIWDLITR